jgi:hypothetical protein
MGPVLAALKTMHLPAALGQVGLAAFFLSIGNVPSAIGWALAAVSTLGLHLNLPAPIPTPAAPVLPAPPNSLNLSIGHGELIALLLQHIAAQQAAAPAAILAPAAPMGSASITT